MTSILDRFSTAAELCGLVLLLGYHAYLAWMLQHAPLRTYRGRANRLRRAWMASMMDYRFRLLKPRNGGQLAQARLTFDNKIKSKKSLAKAQRAQRKNEAINKFLGDLCVSARPTLSLCLSDAD